MEIVSSCKSDFYDEWIEIKELAMVKAAEEYVGPGLMGVDTNGPLLRWAK